MKNAPVSCAAALAAALAVTGCATPKMGEPDLDNCMAPKKTKVLGGVFTFHETEFSNTCASAKFVQTIGTLKTDQGKPDLAAAALAVDVYGKLSKKEQELADAMLAREGLSIGKLNEMAQSANTCRTQEDSKGKVLISCPAPFRPGAPAAP